MAPPSSCRREGLGQNRPTMSLDAIELQSGPEPVATIIVLHGLGADGNDFVPVARELDLRQIGAVRFVFPHAPTMPVLSLIHI